MKRTRLVCFEKRPPRPPEGVAGAEFERIIRDTPRDPRDRSVSTTEIHFARLINAESFGKQLKKKLFQSN